MNNKPSTKLFDKLTENKGYTKILEYADKGNIKY